MSLLRFLFVIYFIIGFTPVFRFRGHQFFYFLFASGLIDPVYKILSHLFHTDLDPIIYMQLASLILFLSFPLITTKIKILLSIPVVVFTYHFEKDVLLILLFFIGIQILIVYHLMNNFISEIKKEQKGSYYLVILSLLTLLDAIRWFVYIENVTLYVSHFQIFLVINILLLILLTLSGSNTKIKVPVFLLKLIYKNVNNITVPSNGNGNTLYHKIGKNNKYYLTERECEVLGFIAKGLTSNEMGMELSLSKKTIDHHRANIKSKIGFSDTVRTLNFLEKNKYNNKNGE